MAEDLEHGDTVEWSTPQGKTSGTVKEKVTGEKRVGNTGQKGPKVTGSEGRHAPPRGEREVRSADGAQGDGLKRTS